MKQSHILGTLLLCFSLSINNFAQSADAQFQSGYLNDYLNGNTSLMIQKPQLVSSPDLALEWTPDIKINKYQVYLYNLLTGRPIDLNLTIPRTPHEKILDLNQNNLIYDLPNQFGGPSILENTMNKLFLKAIF